jgi:hypothetical protein
MRSICDADHNRCLGLNAYVVLKRFGVRTGLRFKWDLETLHRVNLLQNWSRPQKKGPPK